MDKQKFSVVITGSRNWTDDDAIWIVLNALRVVHPFLEVHVGDAKGADAIVQEFSIELGIPCHVYSARWEEYGRAAGPLRNREMLDKGSPDLVVAFPRADSMGTWDCVRAAQERGIRVEVHRED